MRRLSLPTNAIARARHLRRTMTPSERKLWSALREAFPDDHWRKQVPFGPYTADFCSHGLKLIIEVDGSQHALRLRHDADRTNFLSGEGYRVIRFWNHEALTSLEGVIAVIEGARVVATQ